MLSWQPGALAVRRLAMQLVTAQQQWVITNVMKRECVAVPTLAPLLEGVSKVDLLLVCYRPLANLKNRLTRRIVRDTQLG